MSRIVATFFYVGLLRPAPGTWGSLAGLAAGVALHAVGGAWLLTVAALALYFVGLWSVREATAGSDDKDPSEIVIDEVVGQWIALLPTALGASMVGLPLLNLWPGVVSAFVFFRLFDIWKPGLVGRADRRGDAAGVMLDDVWAGAFAGLVTMVLAGLSHWVLM